jgi:hypothetical protein
MLSRTALTIIVLCSISPLSSGARIKQQSSGPSEKVKQVEEVAAGSKEANEKECGNKIASRTMEIMDRITVYFGLCGLEEKHASAIDQDGTVTLNEEGLALLCEPACRDHVDLAGAAPDSSELVEQCIDGASKAALRMILVHDAFDKARKECALDEAPLIDVQQDLEHEDVQPEIDVDNSDSNDGKGEDKDSGKVVETVDDHSEIEDTVDLPQVSPVAPLKGNMVKQLRFEFELKDALASRSSPSCKQLKKKFRECDYKRTGKITVAQVDNMLDQLEPRQKVESLKILREIAENVGKDPERDFITFKDWTFKKLGVREAAACALEYAMRKSPRN